MEGLVAATQHAWSHPRSLVVSEVTLATRFPGVWALGEGNFYEFTHSDRPAVLVALGPEVGEDLEQEIRGAQREFSQEFLFGALNGSHWSEELKMFNIHPQEPGPNPSREVQARPFEALRSPDSSDLNAPYSRAELKRVKAVRFTMFDADTLTAYSVAEISSNEIYRNGQPVHGGVNDPRLGPIDVRSWA
ncbi:RPII [Symbiodinium necroappetens]|uniref:DNA-directed RNA polymerase n=1 Tax=Symbiodinium necroappetens TaxID=1628268 RepID=A0A813CD05_9DINO|nr:RPII [Symbiodinium necroappetens]